MRTPLSLAGAWYAAALPNGEHAALYANGRIATSRGDIALPPGDQPLFLDAGEIDGQLCIGGQSHAGHGLLVWDGTKWRTPGVPAFGESPVCFGLSDEILSVGPGDVLAFYHLRNGQVTLAQGIPLGVDGLRGVTPDGIVLRGNNTRADPARIIGEYTELGDVTVGQSGYSCVALHGGKRYVLVTGAQPGGCRAIRFKRQGDRLAVAVHLPTEARTLLIWCTVAELAQFPEQSLPETPMALMAPNEIEAVRRAMAAHPEINTKDEATRGRVLDYACADANTREPRQAWGRKARNADGSNKNTDVMAFLRPDNDIEYYDSIDGTSGGASWGPSGPFKPGQNGYWTKAEPIDGSTHGPTPPNVHMYDGGEHDTDECDICHLSRFDPVHIIPESTVKHTYNGGEQDTGLCDICQKPVGDPIHNTAPTPQEPPGGTSTPGGTVSLDDDAMQLLTQILESCHAQEERQAETTAAVQQLKDAVGGAGKNLGSQVLSALPGLLGVLLPILKKAPAREVAAAVTKFEQLGFKPPQALIDLAAAKPAAKRKRR